MVEHDLAKVGVEGSNPFARSNSQLSGPDGELIADRETADELRNTQLLVPVADLPELTDPDDFYDHQLVGLAAELPDGSVIIEWAYKGEDYLVKEVLKEAGDAAVLEPADAREAVLRAAERLLTAAP